MKTTLKYDHYFDYEELTQSLQKLVSENSDYCRMKSLGTTAEKREIWALEVTDLKTGDFDTKPAEHIDGNTHAGEVTGSMVAMHTLDTLLSNKDNPEIKELLEKFTFTFIPRISPDGAEYYLKSAKTVRSINKAYPSQRQLPGLVEEDLDGDGVVRLMLVKNSNGIWKKDKQDERILIRRKPDEMKGEFYDLYPEGIVEGELTQPIEIAPRLYSMDFNRNYPCFWLPTQRGAGDYPLDNIETKAVADFIIAHKNIGTMVTHHTSGGMILNPPGPWSEKDHEFKHDIQIYHEIGEIGTEETGYPLLNLYDGFHCTPTDYAAGAGDDWAYLNRGVFAVTIELWDMMARAGVSQAETLDPTLTESEQENNRRKAIMWIDENCPGAYKKWEKINHPQFKEVEIGGLDGKFVYQNCPPAFLEAECKKSTKFTLRFAKLLPRIRFQNEKVEILSNGLVKVSVDLMNEGYLSTSISGQRKKLSLNKPITVSLSGVTVLSGNSEIHVDELEGYNQENSHLMMMGVFSRPAHRVEHFEWIVSVQGNQQCTLCAKSENAGQAQITLKLG